MIKLIFTMTEMQTPEGATSGFHVESTVDVDDTETIESVMHSTLIQSRILLIGLIRLILAEHFGFILHSTADPRAQFLTDIETEIRRRQDEMKATRSQEVRATEPHDDEKLTRPLDTAWLN